MFKGCTRALMGAVVSLAASGPAMASTLLDFEGFTFSLGAFTGPISDTYASTLGVTFDAGSNVLRTDGANNFTPVNTGRTNEVAAYLDTGSRIVFFVQDGFNGLGFDYASNQPVEVSVYDLSWNRVDAASQALDAVPQNCNPSVHFSCWASASFGFSATAYYGVLQGTTQELLVDNLLLDIVGVSVSTLVVEFASAPWNDSSSQPGSAGSGGQGGAGSEPLAPGGPGVNQLPASGDVPLPWTLPLVGLGLAMVGRTRIRIGR